MSKVPKLKQQIRDRAKALGFKPAGPAITTVMGELTQKVESYQHPETGHVVGFCNFYKGGGLVSEVWTWVLNAPGPSAPGAPTFNAIVSSSNFDAALVLLDRVAEIERLLAPIRAAGSN